ncbi:MAG: hypothetical protein IKK75_09820 [Clostridia bacterium]|nr:hypothetical protein [Clostridia bacterium]
MTGSSMTGSSITGSSMTGSSMTTSGFSKANSVMLPNSSVTPYRVLVSTAELPSCSISWATTSSLTMITRSSTMKK